MGFPGERGETRGYPTTGTHLGTEDCLMYRGIIPSIAGIVPSIPRKPEQTGVFNLLNVYALVFFCSRDGLYTMGVPPVSMCCPSLPTFTGLMVLWYPRF